MEESQISARNVAILIDHNIQGQARLLWETLDNATAAEEALHGLLHSKRFEGEWFKLTAEQKKIILSIKSFEKGQFWISDEGVDVDKLFERER